LDFIAVYYDAQHRRAAAKGHLSPAEDAQQASTVHQGTNIFCQFGVAGLARMAQKFCDISCRGWYILGQLDQKDIIVAFAPSSEEEDRSRIPQVTTA
jgi:hypothetical protein